jgi:hypothetical protein
MKLAAKLGVVTVALVGLFAGVGNGAAASAAVKTQSTPLPALYNYDFSTGGWTLPEVKQTGAWLIFIDGSAFIYKFHWSRWNGSTAVATAVYYDRTGPCCTKADQHYYRITMTLSDVLRRGGPKPGPYFGVMTLTGGVHARLAYDLKYKIWNGVYYKH